MQRRRDGDFLILDNGAAEGAEFGPPHLHTLAAEVEANEIVVPDALRDKTETIARAKHFVPYMQPDYKYMAVLQGTTQQEVLSCLNFFDNAPDMMGITCIGIPRVLNEIKRAFRLQFTEWLIAEQFHNKFQLHFLGASSWTREVQALAATVEGLEVENMDSVGFRGIDTSMPIQMGLIGKNITDEAYEPHEGKTGFFEATRDRYSQVMRNIDYYLRWADSPQQITYDQG